MDDSWNELPFGSSGELYERLPPNHIRLVKLDGIMCAMPHCALTTVPCDPIPDYIAISYTWGFPEDASFLETPVSKRYGGTRTIVVNGVPFQVYPNLYYLLGQIWALGDDSIRQHWIWIDAICINQADDVEKSEQVNRMGQIYEDSTWTLVWLGHSYNTTGRVASMFSQIQQTGQDSVIAALHNKTVLPLPWSGVPDLGLNELVTWYDWRNLIYFCKRSWFIRLWTLQELVLSPECRFLCGTHWIEGNTIEAVSLIMQRSRLVDWLAEMGGVSGYGNFSTPLEVHILMRNLVGRTETDEEFWTRWFHVWYNIPSHTSCAAALLELALTVSADFACKDPRDRVFALLSMVKKAIRYRHTKPLTIQADYRKSISEVYMEAMTSILVQTGCLTPLLRSRQPTASIDGLPSWVPDFAAPKLGALLASQYNDNKEDWVPYNASRDTFLGFTIAGRALTFYHHVIATVTHVSGCWDEIEQMSWIRKIAELLLARVALRPERRFWAEELRKAMLCGLKGKFECSDEEDGLSFRSFLCMLLGNQISIDAPPENGLYPTRSIDQLKLVSDLAELDDTDTIPDPKSLKDQLELHGHQVLEKMAREILIFEYNIRQTLQGRRLFLLDNGDIGLGHQDLEPGDALCIVADGGRTPVSLRRQPSESGHLWRWIGEAYVDHIMYGEGVDQMEREGETWQQATII